jgi:hypothetical protein
MMLKRKGHQVWRWYQSRSNTQLILLLILLLGVLLPGSFHQLCGQD